MRHFDVVVIGGRLSAVITAALLAKRGLRGLLVDQGELGSAPWLADLVWDEEASPVMAEVHAELVLREELRAGARPLEPLVQVIFPDQRLDLFTERPRLLAEVARCFGAAPRDAFEAVLGRLDALEAKAGTYLAQAGELPASGFFARRSAAALARRHEEVTGPLAAAEPFSGLPPDLGLMLLAPLPFLGHLDARRPEEVSVARWARTLGRSLRGASRVKGAGARAIILGAAEKRGFEVKRSAVETVEPKGRVVELRIAGQRDPVTTDLLIDASSDLSGLDALPRDKQKKELALALQAARPKSSLFALSLELDEHVLPPGLGDHALLLNGRRDPNRFEDGDAEDRPIWLTTRRRGDGRAELLAVHPLSSALAHARGVDRLAEVMRARLTRLIPFLAEGRPAQEPLTGGRGQGGFLHHPLLELDLDPLSGIAGISMRTPYKNVLVAGPAVLPGLGIEGEYLTARQAADAAVEASGAGRKKGLLARVT